MGEFEAMLFGLLTHNWQTTKRIVSNVPEQRIQPHSVVDKTFHYLDKMAAAGVVEK